MTQWESFDPNNITYGVYTLGRGERAKTYIDIGFCFDIETTSTQINGRDVSWLYHWQMGFGNDVYYGRTLYECVEMFRQLNDYLVKIDKNIICLIHNLAYEFGYLCQYMDFTDVFATAPHKVIKCCYGNIEFRCSYAFSNMSLNLLSQTYTSTKKAYGDLDYSVVRYPETALTEKEKWYCYCDCKVLLEFWYAHILPNYIRVKRPWLPLTNTAKVRQDMRRRISDWRAYKRAYSSVYPNLPIYQILRLCFYGGVVRANAHYTGKVLRGIASRDRGSSYPAVQFHYPYPMGRFIRVKPNDVYDNKYAKIYRLVLTNVKAKTPLSIIPVDKALKISSDRILDNGRLYSCSAIELYTTDIDFEIWKKFYTADYTIIEQYVSKKGRLCRFQIESLIEYYDGKNSLKGLEGKEEMYLKSKNMLNSNFGCCVQKHNDKNDVWNGLEWEVSPIDYEEGSSEFLLYQVGVWITAYARYELLRTAYELMKDGAIVVYMDTDSIKYFYEKGKHEHIFDKIDSELVELTKSACEYYNIEFEKVEKLGLWDLETEKIECRDLGGGLELVQKMKTYHTFKTLGSKRYAHNGDVTLSGMPKQAWKNLCSEMDVSSEQLLHHGLTIPPEKSGKTTMTYYLNQPEEELLYTVGGVEHTLTTPKCYIHAKDSPFSVSLSSDYMNFIEFTTQEHPSRGLYYND